MQRGRKGWVLSYFLGHLTPHAKTVMATSYEAVEECSSPPSGWILHGVLEKSSRDDIRMHASAPPEEGVEKVQLFRCGTWPESLDALVSPLKPVKTPTLLELKEYKDLTSIKRCLDQHEKVLAMYMDDWEAVRIGRLKVFCVGFVQEVTHAMNSVLVGKVGKKLGRVNERDRIKLAKGPFKKNQAFDKKCGTYLELADYNEKHPDEFYESVLREVEQMTIQMFNACEHFPKDYNNLRHLLLHSFMTAKRERDQESHVGMLKEKEKLDNAVRKVKQEIKDTQLKSVGMEHMVPLVHAGIISCMTSLATKKDEEEEDAKEEEELSVALASKACVKEHKGNPFLYHPSPP